MMQSQVRSALQWAEKHKKPVTVFLLEPINPEHVAAARSQLERFLDSVNHHPAGDTLVYEGPRTLEVLHCDQECALSDDLFGSYQHNLKQEGIVLASHSLEYLPRSAPELAKGQPKPLGSLAWKVLASLMPAPCRTGRRRPCRAHGERVLRSAPARFRALQEAVTGALLRLTGSLRRASARA